MVIIINVENNFRLCLEASLGRIEVQMSPFGARFDLNLTTSIGIEDKQIECKLFGIGFSIGMKGWGIFCPVGAVGVGRF